MNNPASSRMAVFLALMAALAVLPTVGFAGDQPEMLEEAIRLFDARKYLDAQELLVQIDRSELSPDQQTERDEYLSRVQVAITMSEKALRDLEDAETALDEGEKEQAIRLLNRVLVNDFGAEALKRAADQRLRDLGEEFKPPAGQEPTEAERSEKPEKVEAPAAPPSPPPASPPAAAQPTPAPPSEPPAQETGAVNGGRAHALTAEADELVRLGRYEEARGRYEEALRSVPGYPEALEGLRRVALHERNLRSDGPESLIQRINRTNAINWQRSVTEYRDLERLIRNQVEQERFDEAGLLLIRARQVVEAGRQFADPVGLYDDLRRELDALTASVQAREREFNERTRADVTREIEQQRRKRLREIESQRAAQVEALMNQAVRHRKDGNLDGAINVLREITIIDPRYRPARWLMDEYDARRDYERGREIREELNRQTHKSMNLVEEAKIPWADQLRYPKNWPELIARPDRRKPDEFRQDRRLFGALDRRIPVDFPDMPFDRVIEHLAEANQLNIIVNWNDLKRTGIEKDTLVDLSLPRDMTLKKALSEVLEQIGGGVDVGFEVAEGAIKIATQQTLDKQVYTATYDINDLLFEIPMFSNPPATDLNRTRQTLASAAPNTDSPQWRSDYEDEDEPTPDPGRRRRVNELIDLIQDTIAPDSWIGRNGSIGVIREFNGQLVITQNSAIQGQVADLLGQLRAQRAVQIAIEARFITVTSNYLEELGIDLDIVLNNGNAGFDFVSGASGALTDPVLGSQLLLPRSLGRLGFTPNAPGLGTALPTDTAFALAQPFTDVSLVPRSRGGAGGRLTPVPVTTQVTAFANAQSLGSDIAGSFAGNSIGPAFSLFGSFLDNIQVDFLIRATQADSRSTVLTSPQLVLSNGQRAFVVVSIQQGYVSQLQPVVATGAAATAPTTSVVSSGAVLDVEATVTADKRYVTMTVRPSVTRLLALQTIPFGGTTAGGGFGGGAAATAAFIQLPTLSTQQVQTTVTIPDGGTLLIGGQKLGSETEVDAGVPILSKIPVLKRLYSARTMVKDEQTLLMLVKPRILIQAEQEELAFPSFGAG